MEILGIDAGNDNVKIAGNNGCQMFSSFIGEYRDRKLVSSFGSDDMIFEYKGQMGFAGTLAKMESETGGSRKGDSKAHEEAKLRILLAIHRYTNDPRIKIVVGQPIGTHIESEKEKIKNMLIGDHALTVNGVTKTFTIERCEVGSEGGAAAFSDPKMGLQRYIDIGSGTINYATTYDMKWVDKGSFTKPFGLETLNTKDLEQIARMISNNALEKWSDRDNVRILGGGSMNKELVENIKKYFYFCTVLTPKLRTLNQIQVVQAIFGNAVGNLEIARKIYA